MSQEQIKEHSKRIDGTGTIDGPGSFEPLYVLNDRILPDNFFKENNYFDKIKPEHIDSITVLKGDAGRKFYGKKGQNGVVKIYIDREILNDLKQDTSEDDQ